MLDDAFAQCGMGKMGHPEVVFGGIIDMGPLTSAHSPRVVDSPRLPKTAQGGPTSPAW
jgi:hypothetical protein